MDYLSPQLSNKTIKKKKITEKNKINFNLSVNLNKDSRNIFYKIFNQFINIKIKFKNNIRRLD